MDFKQFQAEIEAIGLTAIDHGDGHWTVKGGKNVVHWWPESRKRTIHIEGSKWTRTRGTVDQVIRAATKVDVPGNLKLRDKKLSGHKPVPHSVSCPECGSRMTLRNSRFGLFYGCSNYPECDATHGAHPDGRPLGTPADEDTKQARIAAHAAFDTIWQNSTVKGARKRAYRWLAEQLGLSADDCHIGMFDQATCERVVEVCLEQRPNLNGY